MDTDNITDKDNVPIQSRKRGSRIGVALALILIGTALLLQQVGVPLPSWLLSWQILLIALGIVVGFSQKFRQGGWAVMIIIGVIFLLDDVLPNFSFHRFMWPIVVISIGLLLIIRPRHYDSDSSSWNRRWQRRRARWEDRGQQWQGNVITDQQDSEDFFDSTSVFGGVKKIILSKNFKGGDITCFMGGCEIDLTQADVQQRASIDVTQIFGGTKLIVPAHWQIRTDMTALFGNVEDKRRQPVELSPDKVLILQGTSIFGGIEIKSF